MDLIQLLLIAVGLAADSLAVSVSSGTITTIMAMVGIISMRNTT